MWGCDMDLAIIRASSAQFERHAEQRSAAPKSALADFVVTMLGARYGDGVRGTAEITTSACAIGPSSVMDTSMRASQPTGVMA
jgi:hypothetical protein